MKKLLYIGIAVVVVVLFVFTLKNNKAKNEAETAVVAQKNSSVAVKTETVKSEDVTTDFVANGTFAPFQELNFSAEKSGKVTKILVKEGDRVTVGQTLAIIRGDVASVEAQTANATYQNAVADYNRFESAYKTGGVTKQQLDQAQIAMVNAQSRLKQANISLGDTRVKAPISGIINKKYIEVGSMLTSMPATEMFEIVNTSKLKLNVTVNENQVSSLKAGNKVKVTAGIYPDKQFDGKISFVAAKADASLNFVVEVEIANNANGDLKAGMYGTAHFETGDKVKAPIRIVSRNAFVGSVSNNQVFVVKDNTAKLTKIVSGRIFGDKVEVLDGLSDGDIVVISGQINLSDGSKVEIAK